MLRPLLISAAMLCAANAHAQQSQHFLVTFPNTDIENKAKISLHHNLIGDRPNGVLFTLSKEEQSLLKRFGATLQPADNLAKQFLTKQQNIFDKLTSNSTGIPGFSCYATVEETFQQVDDLVAAHPEYTELVDIGDSWQKQNKGEGYDLKVLKIGKKDLVNPPTLFIQSAMHARELATAALTLDFAKQLLAERETNADINWILETQQIHILFQTNPDGRKIAETGVSQRKNVNENHCVESSVGVDLNRNFSFGWGTVDGGSSGDACAATYRGDAPGSEPEVAAVENYVRSIFPDQRGPNVSDAAPENTQGLYLDIHSYSKLILWPWGGSYDAAPNAKGLESLGRKLAYFNNYTPMQSVGLYPTDGTSDNLAYGELGIAHITFELGTAFFQSCSHYNALIKPSNLKALLYAAKVTKAPYQLSQGPDVTDINLALNGDGQIVLKANATDTRFKDSSSWPTHTITKVRYAINNLVSENNAQIATFSDGNANSTTEQFEITVSDNELINKKATVYIQAQDSEGYWGTITAHSIDTNPPSVAGNINCSGAKCQFNVENAESGFDYKWQLSTGDVLEGESATQVLPALGSYSASLVVTNSIGVSNSLAMDFGVTELFAPEAVVSHLCNYLACEFDASGSTDVDSETLTYAWKVEDSSANGELFTHTFSQAGSYKVELVVTDEHEQEARYELDLKVEAEPDPVPLPEVIDDVKKDSSGSNSLFGLLVLTLGAFIRRARVKH
ncbi:M14 family zinc carboxypeptidase [Pseudoalteromonas sp. SSM20]|uniref:M14 family zinc carboxypeptidase n=1 Tax=Pseudoalteromonas sp. SSM20 TaxID=3139394 RepID=UPI003BAD366F